MARKHRNNGDSFQAGEWLLGTGPEADIAICTRVRLARNLQPFVFPGSLRTEDAGELVQMVTERLGTCTAETLTPLDVAGLDDLDRQALVERHLISREFAGSKRPRAVLMNRDESIAVMVNEEDHLRAQVFASGLQTDAVWRRAERLDDALMQLLPVAFSEEFGFLTACPTNAGTGLRLSVMLHLPGLVWSEEIDKVPNMAQKIHLAVRGLYGEGSRALGDFYQVSNQVTMGRSEQEILSDVRLAVSRLISWEREVREALLRGPSRVRTLDRVLRALGVIERAQILTSEEALTCMSALRFGCHEQVIDDLGVPTLNKALLLSQPAHLQRHCQQRLDAADRDARRAVLLREVLGVAPK